MLRALTRFCTGFAAAAALATGLLLSPPSFAQSGAIKAVLDDLARLEPQIDALSPGQGAGIKRLQNLLRITVERLDGADHADPAAAAAAARVAEAQQALTDLAAGKMPGEAAPAGATGAEDAEATAAAASGNADVTAAQAELERIAQGLAAVGPEDADRIGQYGDALAAVESTLRSTQDGNDPGWVAAAKRYNELTGQLNQLINAAAAQQPAAATGAAEAVAERAERELAMIERQVESMQPADKRLADRFLGDLARIEQDLGAVADQGGPLWTAAAEHRQALEDAIVDRRAAGLEAEVQTLAGRIGAMTPLQLATLAEVDPVRSELRRLRDETAALGSPENTGVTALVATLAAVGAGFDGRVAAAAMEQARFGDVAVRLAEIEAQARAMTIPPAVTVEAGDAEIAAYAAAHAAAQARVAAGLRYLESIEGKVPLDGEQANSFEFSKNQLAFALPQALEQSAVQSAAMLDAAVDRSVQVAGFLATTDPADVDHQANRLLGAGEYEDYMAQLQAGLVRLDRAAALDAAIGRVNGPDRAAQRAKLEQTIAAFAAMRQAALGSVRMPGAKSDDPKLLEIAAEVLARPEYGFAYRRMVVNSGRLHREERTGDIDVDTNVTTVTLYDWSWDEFQVTTAEQVGNQWFMFANRLRYFDSGGPTTPLGRWILADRFQGSEILEANIAK